MALTFMNCDKEKYIFKHYMFLYDVHRNFVKRVTNAKAIKNLPKHMVLIRRDYLRKLKHRSSKYQTQGQSREAELFSVGNEVVYVQAQQAGEDTKYKKYIRHFLSDDITQDTTQAYAQMLITNKWAVKEKKAKLLMYLEDGASQHYKNVNACADKLRDAQNLGVPILTFWSCTDDGKSEVDGAGKAFANTHVTDLVPDVIEKAKDPLDCKNLRDSYNITKKFVKKENRSKSTCVDYREAFAIEPQTIEELRASRPTFETLVFIFLYI